MTEKELIQFGQKSGLFGWLYARNDPESWFVNDDDLMAIGTALKNGALIIFRPRNADLPIEIRYL
jgi:hypothetical protein